MNAALPCCDRVADGGTVEGVLPKCWRRRGAHGVTRPTSSESENGVTRPTSSECENGVTRPTLRRLRQRALEMLPSSGAARLAVLESWNLLRLSAVLTLLRPRTGALQSEKYPGTLFMRWVLFAKVSCVSIMPIEV